MDKRIGLKAGFLLEIVAAFRSAKLEPIFSI
jgi:hypothetical protein